jgi:HD-GYP domain-containing protein (c-di-GMP phosphodiesterase class II)
LPGVKLRLPWADDQDVSRHGLTTPSLLALAAAFATLPAASLHFLGRQEVRIDAYVHFVGVGGAAGVAALAAGALTIVGARRDDGRTVLVGTAFSVMAALLCVHGLATPGFLVEMNGVVAFSGGATLPVGGALLALATLPSLRRPKAVRPVLVLQGVLLTSVFALGAAGIAFPSLVPGVPEPRSGSALALLVAGLAFYGLVAYRALRTYLLTHRASDLAVVIGVAWLAAALVAALTLTYLDLGWWFGHGLEVLGIAVVGAPVALDLHRSAQSRPLLGDFRGADLVDAEEAFLGPRVRTLTTLLAQRDTSTEEHTRRVALRAVQVGEELGLSPGRLRTLAAGGLLHDIGKLSVPDTILGKPGPLTEREYSAVQLHAERGDALLRELGGFTAGVRRLVRNHHERLDGSGYPTGLPADAIDLETRILCVCDVYDALVSPRVYRPAWSHADALALLRDESAFDPRCVSALERVLEQERASAASGAPWRATASSSARPRTRRRAAPPVPTRRPS